MQLGRLLTRSGLKHPEASSVVSPGSFCLLDLQFLIILGNLLRVILFTYFIQFLLHCVHKGICGFHTNLKISSHYLPTAFIG
jgi:hypothetical protein